MYISWIIAKHMKLFIDTDIVKECMIEMANVLFYDKKDIIESIRSNSLFFFKFKIIIF